MIDPGDIVLVETPAYLGALQAFQAYGAKMIGLSADENGIRPENWFNALKSSSRRPKFLSLIPNSQNPTGTSTSAQRRATLVEIAGEFDLPVIEDDPYGQLRYSGDPLPALGSMPGAKHWAYLGTASKIMAPGLRVAWLVASDRKFYDRLVTAKQAADLHTSTFTQRLVYRYLQKPGALEQHVKHLCAVYARRRDVMLACLKRHLPSGCSWTQPEGGLFLWVRLSERVDTTDLLKTATQHKVAFVPGEPFWVGQPVRNTLRLNFSNATEEKIEEGIARLGRIISETA